MDSHGGHGGHGGTEQGLGDFLGAFKGHASGLVGEGQVPQVVSLKWRL
jgi:hypothetical protein